MACSDAAAAHAAKPSRWRLSATQSHSNTRIAFSGLGEATLRRSARSFGLEYRFNRRWTLQAGAGIAQAGELKLSNAGTQIGLGPLAVVAAAYRVLDGQGGTPFLLLATALSFSSAPTQTAGSNETARLTAVDGRVGVSIGKLFFKRLAPYATARAFGGPVFWRHRQRATLGSDKYHVQLGAGLLVRSKQLDAFVEFIPVGERALSSGLAYSF